LASCRPGVEIIAATPEATVARSLAPLRAVVPLVVDRPVKIEDAIPRALDAARSQGLLHSGDKVVVCASRANPRSDADTLWLHVEP
jgi:pyruvate kinase